MQVYNRWAQPCQPRNKKVSCSQPWFWYTLCSAATTTHDHMITITVLRTDSRSLAHRIEPRSRTEVLDTRSYPYFARTQWTLIKALLPPIYLVPVVSIQLILSIHHGTTCVGLFPHAQTYRGWMPRGNSTRAHRIPPIIVGQTRSTVVW